MTTPIRWPFSSTTGAATRLYVARWAATWSTVASGRSGSSDSSSAPATSVDGGSRSSRWMCAQPMNRPVGVSSGAPAHVDERGERRREVGVADVGQGVGDGGVRGEDHRLGGHHPAGGVLDVRHQPPHVLGLLRLHQLEQRLGGLGRQLGDQVGRVVGVHLLEHVGRALALEQPQDLDLVLLGQLLQHVGEPLVGERGHDGGTPLGGQVVDHAGRVGGPELVEGVDQLGRALGGLGPGQPGHLAPLDHVRLALAAQPLGRLDAPRPG